MRFSIITICYNEESRIEKTLESVYKQTFRDFEHIIEDGGSKDETLSIVQANRKHYDEHQLRVYSEQDAGLYDAMNRAIARAKGDYLCFINSGDFLFDEDTLKKVSDEIDKIPDMDWYYGMAIYVFPNNDEYAQIPCTIENIEGKDITEVLKRESLNLNHQTIYASRRCFDENLFDTRYKLRAELKWYYKCLLSHCKVKRMDFPVCRYSMGGYSERVSSVELHANEVHSILGELDLLTEYNRSSMPAKDNAGERCRIIYNNWLALRQAGRTVSEFLLKQKIHRIAIYGYAEFGTHLINELKHSEIKIICMIDRQSKYPFSNIPVIHPSEDIGEVDAVIVTALLHFAEIKEYLCERTSARILSLEDVLEDMWL